MEMKVIDARGRSCPEPVILTKKAIDSGIRECAVLVDNRTAQENVTRFAKNAGFDVEQTQEDGGMRLNLKKI